MNKAPVRTRLWSPLFLLVVVQMTTTLRPLVGRAGSELIQPRSFFVAHWVASLQE